MSKTQYQTALGLYSILYPIFFYVYVETLNALINQPSSAHIIFASGLYVPVETYIHICILLHQNPS